MEGALGVERVGNGWRRDGAVHVEVEVADGTLVAGADANLLATITLKGEFRILKLELVMGVAEVGNFAVFCHGVWVKFVWGFEKENFEKNVFIYNGCV